jgi:hypothetical protein
LGPIEHVAEPTGVAAVPGAHVHGVVNADDPDRYPSPQCAVAAPSRDLEFTRLVDVVELLTGPRNLHGFVPPWAVDLFTRRTGQYVPMADAGVQIDHIVIGVRDLDNAQAQFEDRYGLTTIGGGRHPGWGTANRLVPLGAAYLELVTVVDQAEASHSDFGRWVSAMLEGNSRFGWAVRTDDLDRTATRLGLEVAQGSRRTPAAETLQWRLAGVAQAAQDSSLPFFIEWGQGTPLPGQATVAHRAGAVALGELTITGNEQRVNEWLGTTSLPIRVTPGIAQGVASFSVMTSTNTVVVSPNDW